MPETNIQLKITRGQIPIIEKRLVQQIEKQQELLSLSKEMYKSLYEPKVNKRLLQRWQQIIQQLLI